MTAFRGLLVSLLIAVAAPLSGCELPLLAPGKTVILGPNEGIAGVVMDSEDALSRVSIESTGNDGRPIAIPQVPKGVSLYVFVVPPGRYCVTGFHFGSLAFHPTDPKPQVCFNVVTGKITYSGNIAPRAYGSNDIRIDQLDNHSQFEQMLKTQYPGLAAKYPIVIE